MRTGNKTRSRQSLGPIKQKLVNVDLATWWLIVSRVWFSFAQRWPDSALHWVVCCTKLSVTCDVTASRNTVGAALPQWLPQSEPLHFRESTSTSRLGLTADVSAAFSLQTCGLCISAANWSINISERRQTVGTPVQQVWPLNARQAPRTVLFYIMRRQFWPLAAVPRNDQSGLKGIFPKMPFHALFKETSGGRIGKHAAVWVPASDQFHSQSVLVTDWNV